ncbi:MAG: hypothetical protein Q8O53_00910, partial [Candidatus Moranbacteria bacterium]|nr:hypothetical protein [Candidatus Moranbacteria bacterium]
MKFIFKGKDSAGALREGMVEAINAKAATDILARNGLTPISITEEKEVNPILRDFQKIFEGLSQKEIVVFFRQLSTLVEARVPVVSSLVTIQEQTTN